MRRHGLNRRAFSLAEMMVVIFVSLIVLGLFIVWAGHQREPHGPLGRTQTNNNLKQCALALHSYHDTYRKFPPAFGPGGAYPATDKSLWFHLLPYVEADNVYKLDPKDAIVPAYNAPADAYNEDPTSALNFAANLRVVAYQTLKAANEPINEPGRSLGVPEGSLLSGLTMGRLSGMDGTSNILMLSSRYSVCGGFRTRYAANVDGSNMAASNVVGGFMGAGSHSLPPSQPGTIDDIFQPTPKPANCLPAPGVFGHSFGSGGMSTALFDGSVKNISPTMSTQTFTRALCPGDDKPLGDDWAED